MPYLKTLALSTFAVALLSAAPAAAPAQISVSIGAPPYCPYGYFDYAPYDCAPYGYYGPDWFDGGVFIGAGPWFHGHPGFYGPRRQSLRSPSRLPRPYARARRPSRSITSRAMKPATATAIVGQADHPPTNEHFAGAPRLPRSPTRRGRRRIPRRRTPLIHRFQPPQKAWPVPRDRPSLSEFSSTPRVPHDRRSAAQAIAGFVSQIPASRQPRHAVETSLKPLSPHALHLVRILESEQLPIHPYP